MGVLFRACLLGVCRLDALHQSATRPIFSGVSDADLAGEGCGAQGRILAPASARWVSSILEEAPGPPRTLAGWVGPFWGSISGGFDVFPPWHTDLLMDCKGYTVVDPLHCSPTFGFPKSFLPKISGFVRLESVHLKIRTIQLFPLPQGQLALVRCHTLRRFRFT